VVEPVLDQHESNDLGEVSHARSLHGRFFSLKTIGTGTGVSVGEFLHRTAKERVMKIDGIVGQVDSAGDWRRTRMTLPTDQIVFSCETCTPRRTDRSANHSHPEHCFQGKQSATSRLWTRRLKALAEALSD